MRPDNIPYPILDTNATQQSRQSGQASYVPPSAFTNTTRDALLRAGLVTEATLRARQIY